jgi:glycine dehydrogenase
MAMSEAVKGPRPERFFVSELCHPQTIDVVRTRAEARGWTVVVGDHTAFEFDDDVFGVLLQYPATDGTVHDYRAFVERAHEAGALVTVAADLLALTLLTPPGEWGADIVVGNSQRFGVPLGFGGPHAGFFATKDEYKRQIPGRIIGVSDSRGSRRCAWRCRRANSTSAARRRPRTSAPRRCCSPSSHRFYAVYHGPEGLRNIAKRIHRRALRHSRMACARWATSRPDAPFFDTVRVDVGDRRRPRSC